MTVTRALEPIAVLIRSPRLGVERILARPSVITALLLMTLACVTSTLVAVRIATEVDTNELFFAGTREPFVQLLIDALGPQRTAVVLYLVQRSFDAVVIATAVSPLFYWLLGSTAIHASARLAGKRPSYAPLLLFFAYATAVTVVPANLAAIALGVGRGLGPQVASLVSLLCLGWLLVIAHRAIRAHYAVDRDTATRILVIAVLVFYLAPLVLIVCAAVAIIVAAVVLEYF